MVPLTVALTAGVTGGPHPPHPQGSWYSMLGGAQAEGEGLDSA